jgi:hypothetical protein
VPGGASSLLGYYPSYHIIHLPLLILLFVV